MQQRLPSLRENPIAFAHRGAKAHARENTLDAFALALKLGANGIETDAWMTADSHVVLNHDGVVRRGIKRRQIASVLRTDLDSHIPSWEDLLQLVSHEIHLSIDIKDVAAAEGIVLAARHANFPADHIWLCHHQLETVLELRHRFTDVMIVDSTRLSRIGEGPEKRAALLAENGINALNMHFTDWNGGLVAMTHRFGLAAFGWDVQFPAALSTAFRMGLDGVYCDYVDRMVDAYVAELGTVPVRI